MPISEYTESKPFLAADMMLSLNELYANDRVEIVTEADPEELERVVSKTSTAAGGKSGRATGLVY